MWIRFVILGLGVATLAWAAFPRRRAARWPWMRWVRGGMALGMCGAMVLSLAVFRIKPPGKRRPPTAHLPICYLPGERLPGTPDHFSTTLLQSLGRNLKLANGTAPVQMGGRYPHLESFTLDLTGAAIPKDYDQPRTTSTLANDDEISIRRLRIFGRPMYYITARIQMELNGRGAWLGVEYDPARKPLLVLNGMEDGDVRVSVPIREIESLLQSQAQDEAIKNKLTVDSTKLQLTSGNGRSMDVRLEIQAHKKLVGSLKIPATVILKGRLDVDNQLTARISGLTCEGDGVVGTIASGLAEPFIRRYEGYSIPTGILTGGQMKVRDVRITADDSLHMWAAFSM